MIIAEELNVPYELAEMDFSGIKTEPFLSINPNGRLPAIEDPNTGITLWEVRRHRCFGRMRRGKAKKHVQSGAIVEYLVDTYDKDNKLSYTKSPQKYTQSSWKHFQMSGQGPYFGQKMWFSMVSSYLLLPNAPSPWNYHNNPNYHSSTQRRFNQRSTAMPTKSAAC